jgi:hypothetical protein
MDKCTVCKQHQYGTQNGTGQTSIYNTQGQQPGEALPPLVNPGEPFIYINKNTSISFPGYQCKKKPVNVDRWVCDQMVVKDRWNQKRDYRNTNEPEQAVIKSKAFCVVSFHLFDRLYAQDTGLLFIRPSGPCLFGPLRLPLLIC